MSDDSFGGQEPVSQLTAARLPPDDRPRGILSKADRKFLRGEKEFDHQESYSRARSRIRERVINGLLDFTVLEFCLQPRDKERIFESFDTLKMLNEDTALYGDQIHHGRAITNVIAFLFEGMKNQAVFERNLAHGIKRGKTPSDQYYQGKYEVNIEINEITPPDVSIEAVVEKVRQDRLETLTEAEMFMFIRLFSRSEAFDPDSVIEEFQRRRDAMFSFEPDPDVPVDSQRLFNTVYDRDDEEPPSDGGSSDADG